MRLNESQTAAVNHMNGPALILSGAGSGKTLVIVERIIRLIEKGVNPSWILALTFTNKAADEMKERVLGILPENQRSPQLSTFHSFCLKYIRIYGASIGVSDYNVIDAHDQKKIQRLLLGESKLDIKLLNSFYYYISCIKNYGLSGEKEVLEFFDNNNIGSGREIYSIYQSYQNTLKQQHLLDFDDILTYFYRMLDDDSVHTAMKDRFRFIMVDEYQDTNRIQYMILKRLSECHRNLFVVGDDDQSIYSFRGACVDNILDFREDYPEAVIIKLEKNYRSKGSVLKLANSVIINNQRRMDKELIPTREYGGEIPVLCGEKPKVEAYKICRTIMSLQDDGYEYGDMAVLYRTNAQSRELEEALREYNIEYKVIGNVGFYERKEIKDIIAYLRLLNNPFDLISLKRIINTPPRRIGERTFSLIESKFNGINNLHQIIFTEKNTSIRIFATILRNITAFLQKSPHISILAEYIIHETAYCEYLDSYYDDSESRRENLESFINLCREFEKKGSPSDLKGFMDTLSLISDQDNMTKTDNAVKLLTVHTAKGLEFPVVFLAGLEEDTFPHKRCMDDPSQIEEERRLFYVAATRAMDILCLSYSKEKFLFGNSLRTDPSRFLREIPGHMLNFEPGVNLNMIKYNKQALARELTKEQEIGKRDNSAFRPGQKINHKKFGYGIIQRILNTKPDKKVVILFFESNDYKTFLLDKLEQYLKK